MKEKLLFIFLVLLLLGSEYTYSQEILGQVLESESKTPIPFVNIGIIGTDIGTVSDSDGKFFLNISEAEDQDSLRFSFVGFEPYDLIIQSIRTDSLPNPVLMEQKLFELDEIFVEPEKMELKTLGVRKKDGYPIPLYRGAKTDVPFPQPNYQHEIGTLFSNNRLVYLDSVQINLSKFSIDTLDLRINIYSLRNGIFENILKEPQYLQVQNSKDNHSPTIDLSTLNLSLENDFLITIENYKRIKNGSVRVFANLKSKGKKFPTYYRSNSQSNWTKLQVNSGDFGISILAYIRQNPD